MDCGLMVVNICLLTDPTEYQKAECTITAGDVRATAEAKVMKSLKGVCSSGKIKLHNS